MRARSKLILLQLGAFVLSAAPLCLLLVFRFGEYTKTPAETVKLCSGAMIVMVLLALKAFNRLHIPGRVTAPAIAFALSYLLQAVLSDLTVILGAYLVGELCDFIVMQPAIARLKENMLIQKTANATAEAMEQVQMRRAGSGRV